MREYEDPHKHLHRSLERSTDRYVQGLHRSGLKPNARLTRAMAERAVREARESYIREATEIRDHNIGVIHRNHQRRLKRIKQEGASLRLKTCPPIAALFGAVAWYCFLQPSGFLLGLLYTFASLAFLAMLVLGAIFDR